MITPYMILPVFGQNYEGSFASLALKKNVKLAFCLLLFGKLIEDVDAVSFFSASHS